MDSYNTIKDRRDTYIKMKKILIHCVGFCNALHKLYYDDIRHSISMYYYPELLELEPKNRWNVVSSFWFQPVDLNAQGDKITDGRAIRHHPGYKIRMKLLDIAINTCNLKLQQFKITL